MGYECPVEKRVLYHLLVCLWSMNLSEINTVKCKLSENYIKEYKNGTALH